MGALITVNYEAGPMGYTQTLDQQDGFVDIKPKPVKVATSSSSSTWGSRFSGATSTASNTGVSATSSSVDQSALISQIIAALQPQINSAVQSALSSSTATATVVATRPVAVAPPRPRLAAPVSRSTGGLAGTFGDGFSVKIDTPEFNIEY